MPDALAIIAERDLTYAELDRRAMNLARKLIEMQIGPDRLVAVFLPRSAALLIAILGTLKSGAAYLPVDIAMPVARAKNASRGSQRRRDPHRARARVLTASHPRAGY